MGEYKDVLMKASKVLFEVHILQGDQEMGSSSSPKDKLSCTHLRWNRDNFKGVIAHIRNSVQQLYFPYCEDINQILILYDTFLIVNDDDVQCLVEDMTYPHNIMRLKCKCTKQDDSDREKKTEKSKDDQLLESLISLCVQDTFPYCKGYFRKNVEKLEDFERIPAKHFAVLMQNIMEVLHFDQETIKSFREKIHLKIKEHNASVHSSPIKAQEHTNSCCSHWQSDASDLLTADVNNKYVKFIMRSATSYSQCMKVAVLDGLLTNIHSASSVSIPGHLEPDHVQTSSAFVGNRHPVSPIKRACPSPSPGMPVHKKSCRTPQQLFHQFSQQPQPTMQPERDTCNINHISMLQKWSPQQELQLYHPSPPNMDNNQIPSDLNNIDLSAVFDDIGSFPTISMDS